MEWLKLDFKFCTLVAPMKYYPLDDNAPQLANSWSRDQFLPRGVMLPRY